MSVTLIPEDSDLYKTMRKLVNKYHPHLKEARIALAGRSGWKPDADGNLRLGQCRKAGDLDQQLHGYDFVIILNADAWSDTDVLDEQGREIILDHELSHAQVERDKDGQVVKDEDGRPKWRLRRHDVEEFHQIVSRHGAWTHTLEEFASVALDRKQAPLLAQQEKKRTTA